MSMDMFHHWFPRKPRRGNKLFCLLSSDLKVAFYERLPYYLQGEVGEMKSLTTWEDVALNINWVIAYLGN